MESVPENQYIEVNRTKNFELPSNQLKNRHLYTTIGRAQCTLSTMNELESYGKRKSINHLTKKAVIHFH